MTEKFDNEWLNTQVRKLYGAGVIKKDNDIATDLGIAKSSVSNYLSGSVKPSKNFIKAFIERYEKFIDKKSIQTLYTLNEESAIYGSASVDELRRQLAVSESEVSYLKNRVDDLLNIIKGKDEMIELLKKFNPYQAAAKSKRRTG